MKISFKIQLLVISVILVMSGAILITINYELIKENKTEVKELRDYEYSKAKQKLENYINIAYQVIDDNYTKYNSKDFLEKKYGDELKNIIDAGETLISRRIEEYKNGLYTLEHAQRLAKEDINLLRYDNGVGYIWINDTLMPYPRMIMHPILPDLNGRILNNKSYNVAMGREQNLFQAAVEVSLNNGDGFVDYIWPKPSEEGVTEDQPKLSYVKLIKEWGWVLGTGIYIDDAKAEARRETLEVIKAMRYDNGTGYFWINNSDQPFATMIMHPISPELNNKVLDNEKYNVVKDTNANLFSQMVEEVKKSGIDGFVEYLWPKPAENGLTEIEPKLSYVKLFAPWDWIIGTGFYIDDIDIIIEEKTEKLRLRIRALNIFIIITSLVLAILLGVIASLLVRTFINPIKDSSDMLSSISKGEGDLTQRLINNKNDEVGDLSNNFNSFVEKLSVIINRVKETNKETGKVKDDLNHNSKITKEEVDDIIGQINDIKRDISQLNNYISTATSDIKAISSEIGGLNENIIEESSALEQSSAAINQMVASIDSVSKVSNLKSNSLNSLLENTKAGELEINKSSNAIKEVYSKIEEIKHINTLINQISAKTNLLAMNAAIEAAHAGELGRGFSVVANEIRKLAESSSNSVKGINDLIKDVIGNIEESFNSSREVQDLFKLINDGVMDVTSGMKEITYANNELNSGGREILEALSILTNISAHVKESSAQMNLMSNSIRISMDSSKELSDNVDNNMERIVNASTKINEAMAVISKLVVNLDIASNKLSDEISRFKT